MALEFKLNPADPVGADTDCVVVGIYADGTLSPAGAALDAASGGRLSALARRGDLPGKTGQSSLLPDRPGL